MERGDRTRATKTLAGVVAGLCLAAGVFWAGRVTSQTGAAPGTQPSSVTAEVRQASVGRVLRMNTTVEVRRVPAAEAEIGGIVTAVARSGHFSVGQQVYAVDGAAVRVVAGEFPFYRDLGPGDSGADVRQLVEALRALRFLNGRSGSTMSPAVVTALTRWQRSTGARADGTVRLGELVAAGTLPGPLWIDNTVAVLGRRVAGGAVVVSRPAGSPQFRLDLNADQAAQISADATYVVTHDDQRWPAVVDDVSQSEDGRVFYRLTAPDGGVVCGSHCDGLPPGQRVFLLTEITVIPRTEGPAVPVAALRSLPDGGVQVIVDNGGGGRAVPVRVRASRDGIAVVDGLAVGDRVVLLGAGPETGDPLAGSASPSPR